MFFSATYDQEVMNFAELIVPNPTVIRLKREQESLDNIRQYYVQCANQDAKYAAITNIYGGISIGQAIIFCHVWLLLNLRLNENLKIFFSSDFRLVRLPAGCRRKWARMDIPLASYQVIERTIKRRRWLTFCISRRAERWTTYRCVGSFPCWTRKSPHYNERLVARHWHRTSDDRRQFWHAERCER